MRLTRLKQLLAVAGLVFGLVGGALLLTGAAVIVVRAGTGADPADAFTDIPAIPEGLRGTVAWLPDAPDLDRVMEPVTRTALEAAWLNSVTATSHDLTVEFYSLDGQIGRLTGTSIVVHEVAGQTLTLCETREAVAILTDGRWELDPLVRIGAEVCDETVASAS